MLCLQETWCKEGHNLEIDNFGSFHFNRPILNAKALRGAGGISIYVKSKIVPFVSILKNHADYLVWICIKKTLFNSEKPLLIGIVYFPPEPATCNVYREDYFMTLENDIAMYQGDFNIFVMGDFNARTQALSDESKRFEGSNGPNQLENLTIFPDGLSGIRNSQDRKPPNNYGRKLVELCMNTEMKILNGRCFNDIEGKFTRVGTTGRSVVDYILCEKESFNFVCNFQIEDQFPESDHCPILLELNSLPLVCEKEITRNYACREKCTKYIGDKNSMSNLKFNFSHKYNSDLLAKFYDAMFSLECADVVSQKWYDYMYSQMDLAFKKVRIHVRPPKIEWFDAECKLKREGLLKLHNGDELFIGETKSYKKIIQSKKRLYRNNMMSQLDKHVVSSPNEFWECVKTISKSYVKEEVMKYDTVCYQMKEMSHIPKQEYFDFEFEEQCEFFLEKFDKDSSNAMLDPEDITLFNENITLEEISFAISKLKANKAPGIDLISAECIKSNVEFLKHHLEFLFNYILNIGSYPEKWAEGLRIAIPKGGDDIRPITIEPIFGKIFEIIIENRLTFTKLALGRDDIYNGGFVKGSQTQDNMLIMTGCIQKQMSLNKNLYIALVDFRKAFNYVNRSILFYKLIKSGFKGKVIRLLRDMYSKIKSRIKISCWLYNWIKDSSGTNQGGPLSPTMFRVMLEDLRLFLEKEHGIIINDDEILIHMLWADDLILMSSTAAGLQKQLDGLLKFCSKYQLIVNTVKTKVMIFGKRSEDEIFRFNKKEVEICKNYKYLGVVFNEIKCLRGNMFKDMIEFTREKALKASFGAMHKLRKFGKPSFKVGIQFFDAYVLPILEYGAEIWGQAGREFKQLERIQTKYIKILIGVKFGTTNSAIYAETGRLPYYLRVKIKTLKYFLRLCNARPGSIYKKVFDMLKNLANLGFNNWASGIRKLLEEHNLSHLWENDVVRDSEGILSQFKIDLHNSFMRKCLEDLHRFPILRTYIKFKNNFGAEAYLENIRDPSIRSIIAKFRLSSHHLAIETGRHKKPKIELQDRLCIYCDQEVIEDECHVLIQCQYYKEERHKFLNRCNLNLNDFISPIDSFVYIMSHKDVSILVQLGIFLRRCFKKRSELT